MEKRERIIEMKNGFQTLNGLKKWSSEQIQMILRIVQKSFPQMSYSGQYFKSLHF